MNSLGIIVGVAIVAGGIYLINKQTGIFSEIVEDIDKVVTRMHDSFWEGYKEAAAN
ncbi:MAG: hypothetical protein WCG27_00630 [Pseudomonadota bacterium]